MHSSHTFWLAFWRVHWGRASIESLTSAATAGHGAKCFCSKAAWPFSAACQAAVGRYMSALLRWCLT